MDQTWIKKMSRRTCQNGTYAQSSAVTINAWLADADSDFDLASKDQGSVGGVESTQDEDVLVHHKAIRSQHCNCPRLGFRSAILDCFVPHQRLNHLTVDNCLCTAISWGAKPLVSGTYMIHII